MSLLACSGSGGGQPAQVPADTDQMQPALAAALDSAGRLWMAGGYTDLSTPGTAMGLSIRAPDGTWTAQPALLPEGNEFRPSGDGWLAATQRGTRAYYVSLLQVHDAAPQGIDDVGDGLAFAVIDFALAAPQVIPPRRIDAGDWPNWDEPTVAATRPPGSGADTVLVAGTPIAPDVQDVVTVLVSHDGGVTFRESPPIHAPDYRVHHSPGDTLVRPVLQQDPRPGQECHAYLAFGVYYPTAFTDRAGIQAPSCQSDPAGCRSIAETETTDCGDSWAPPHFIAVDTGSPQGEDFRGFGYAMATDGTRFVVFGDEDDANAPILLKRAPAGATFTVVQGGSWSDGSVETVASGPGASGRSVRRWRPTIAASASIAVLWIEEDAQTLASTLWMSDSPTSTAVTWTSARRVDGAGVACDEPSDDYMAAAPEGPLGASVDAFVVAWAPFVPCGSQARRHVQFQTLR